MLVTHKLWLQYICTVYYSHVFRVSSPCIAFTTSFSLKVLLHLQAQREPPWKSFDSSPRLFQVKSWRKRCCCSTRSFCLGAVGVYYKFPSLVEILGEIRDSSSSWYEEPGIPTSRVLTCKPGACGTFNSLVIFAVIVGGLGVAANSLGITRFPSMSSGRSIWLPPGSIQHRSPKKRMESPKNQPNQRSIKWISHVLVSQFHSLRLKKTGWWFALTIDKLLCHNLECHPKDGTCQKLCYSIRETHWCLPTTKQPRLPPFPLLGPL